MGLSIPDHFDQANIRETPILGDQLGPGGPRGTQDQPVERVTDRHQCGELVDLSKVEIQEAQSGDVIDGRTDLGQPDASAAQLAERVAYTAPRLRAPS